MIYCTYLFFVLCFLDSYVYMIYLSWCTLFYFILIFIFYKYSIIIYSCIFLHGYVHTFYKYSDFPWFLAYKIYATIKVILPVSWCACVAWFLWYVYHLGVGNKNHSVYLFLVLADTALYCYQILSFL